MASVLNLWDAYLDYDEKDRPSSPMLAAFRMEVEAGRWLAVPYQQVKNVEALVNTIQQQGLLGELLTWIAEKRRGEPFAVPCERQARGHAGGFRQL
jgi:hypothetical protein